MIEKIVLDYLNRTGWPPAYMEDPPGAQTPPYHIIQKTGGGTLEGHVGTATLAIQSFGATLYEAAAANEALKARMAELPTLPHVARCRLNSDYNFTDTASKRYRYQAVFEIVYY